ncbi:MAG TPA: type 1 glutamine amidotransferase domain-containing protein [Gemmatimonadaceae bacterium]|nr:type 1 glutamine amidotransferase domain-containing protein [Gemmatimonadaceae bacterium]
MTPKTIAMLVGPEYEDLEVWYPKLRLEAAGHKVPLVGLGEQSYHGKHGYPCPVDLSIADLSAADLAGVIAPGGWAPDKIRRDDKVLKLVRDVHKAGGLMATICHGPWIFISADIVRGKRLTGSLGIRDDIINAGAIWEDAAVVEDGNLISSRAPRDLPKFGEALVKWLASKP